MGMREGFTRFREAVADWFAPAAAEPEAKMRESAGYYIDPDEDQWRRLSETADSDLAPMTQARMQKIAPWLWESNVLANRLVELPVAYLLAEGVQLSCKDPDSQKILDRFWRDPINNMPLRLPEKVREMSLFGEQCYPAFVNDQDGTVRIGYLDPRLIQTVVMDPDNPSQPIGLITRKDKKGIAKRYEVIINGEEDVFTQRTQEIRKTFADGPCFYYRVNNLAAGTRGRSDLLAQADWLDAYDAFLFGELDRAKFQRSFLWDVTLTGSTPEQVKARAREITAPGPNAVRVHNEAEIWKAEAPTLNAGDSDVHARMFRNHILGGGTMPEHWFGGGGNVNRATAGEMGAPTFKVYAMRQAVWKIILQDIGCYAIRQALAKAGITDIEFDDPRLAVEAAFPELTTQDTAAWATALQQMAPALVVAINEGLMTKETAVRILGSIAIRFGVEIDAEAELKKAQAEMAKAKEADSFTADPALTATGGTPAGGSGGTGGDAGGAE